MAMPDRFSLTLAAALALALAGCGDRPPAEAAPAPPAPPAAAPNPADPDARSVTFAPALGVDLSQMQQGPRGVWYRDLVPGTGNPVVAGQTVSLHYVGNLPDGTKFDASESTDPPLVFKVASGDVVPGFDDAVTGMKAGGKRQVIIPPSLGYGAAGNGPVPGNSLMVFTIELLSVK